MAKRFQIDTGGTLTTNLQAYYKLEDVNDFWSTNNLTNNGGATFVAGKVGNAVNLVRTSNQFLQVFSNVGITGGAASMSIWVNMNANPAAGEYYDIIQQFNNSTQSGYGIWYYNSSGTYRLTFRRDKENVSSSGVDIAYTLTTGTWYHLVLTSNGSTVTAYINNVSQGTSTDQSGNGSGTRASQTGFGFQFNGTPANQPNGIFDETGIWSKALSTTEISDLYNGGSGQTMIANNVYTLSLVQGVYTITGQSLNMIKALRITIVQGAYTLTGQILNFLSHIAHIIMAMGQGAYSLTGKSIGMPYGRMISMVRGTYTLTGQTLVFMVGHTLSLSQGAYVLTGKTLNFIRERARGLIRGRNNNTNTIIGSGNAIVRGRNNDTNTIIGKRL